jgi:hypothetical protein
MTYFKFANSQDRKCKEFRQDIRGSYFFYLVTVYKYRITMFIHRLLYEDIDKESDSVSDRNKYIN